MKYKIMIGVTLYLMTAFSCNKKNYYRDGGLASQPTADKEKTVYDYLKSKPGIFDSLVAVIDAADMKEEINRENITFIASTNLSINRFLVNLGGNTGYSPSYKLGGPIKKLDKTLLRRVLSQYIIADTKLDLQTASKQGKTLYKTVSGDSVYLWTEGSFERNRPPMLYYHHPRTQYDTYFFEATMQTHNLVTKNAIIHVMDEKYSFKGYVKF